MSDTLRLLVLFLLSVAYAENDARVKELRKAIQKENLRKIERLFLCDEVSFMMLITCENR